MKKIVKRILWSLASVLALLIILIGIMGVLLSCEKKKLKPVATGKITENILVVKDGIANFYVYKKDGDIIVIDAGDNINDVRNGLIQLGVNPDGVKAVFLTHSDADHVAGVKLFKNAKVYISRAEEPLATGKTGRFLFMKNHVYGILNLLNDNHVVNIGGINIKGILTPGHTPGSMCYVVDGKFLFIGDTLSLKNGQVEVFNKLFVMNSKTEKQSIKKLSALTGIESLFTGHYGYTNNFAFAFNKWRN